MKTKKQFAFLQLLSEFLREAQEIPTGSLYAVLLKKFPNLSLDALHEYLNVLIKAKLIKVSPPHLITWIGKEESLHV